MSTVDNLSRPRGGQSIQTSDFTNSGTVITNPFSPQGGVYDCTPVVDTKHLELEFNPRFCTVAVLKGISRGDPFYKDQYRTVLQQKNSTILCKNQHRTAPYHHKKPVPYRATTNPVSYRTLEKNKYPTVPSHNQNRIVPSLRQVPCSTATKPVPYRTITNTSTFYHHKSSTVPCSHLATAPPGEEHGVPLRHAHGDERSRQGVRAARSRRHH